VEFGAFTAPNSCRPVHVFPIYYYVTRKFLLNLNSSMQNIYTVYVPYIFTHLYFDFVAFDMLAYLIVLVTTIGHDSH